MHRCSRQAVGAEVVDGRALSQKIQVEVSARVDSLRSIGVEPHLAVVIAGEDPASQIYVRNKEAACQRCGISSTRIDLPSQSSTEEILDVVSDLNSDPSIHGILVQSPSPEGVDELEIARSILPEKDVDGFHPANLGRLIQGDTSGLLPCTPSGVMRILEDSGVKISGTRSIVLGRSRIVGMPMSLLLSQRGVDSTVTLAHSRTAELEELCRSADILIAAVGVPHIVGPEWVKPGAFVVDVGISRLDGKLAGDVSPDASKIAGWVTPVPGGVGPMTIAMLMSNTLIAAEAQSS